MCHLDEFGSAEEEAEHVGHDVVGDDARDGEEEPDHAGEQVAHYHVRLRHYDEQDQVREAEHRELAEVRALSQRQDERHERYNTTKPNIKRRLELQSSTHRFATTIYTGVVLGEPKTSRQRPKSTLYLTLKKRKVFKFVKVGSLWAF